MHQKIENLLIEAANCVQNKDYKKGLECFRQIIDLQPNQPHHYFNCAIFLQDLNRYEEAIPFLNETKRLKPNCPVIRVILAKSLFHTGRFREAYVEQEWRFKYPLKDSYDPNPLVFRILPQVRETYKEIPDWDGKTDLKNKKVLIFNEAGLGDFINYVRYLPLLKEKGAYIIIETPPELERIFKSLKGVDEIFVSNKQDKINAWLSTFSNRENIRKLPECDYVMSINSICHFVDPDLTNISLEPYLQTVYCDEPAKEILDLFADKFKIGIVFAGKISDSNDAYRSVPLKIFKPISKIEGVQLFSLQKGVVKRTIDFNGNKCKINLLDGADDMRVVDLAGFLNDFHDTAEIVKQLDLVISVDTSIVHLTGAMGFPVWMLSSIEKYDCRWQKEWYPSLTIYWQQQEGDWSGAIDEMVKKLKNIVENFSL